MGGGRKGRAVDLRECRDMSTMIDNFRKMHVPGDPFILANAWDIGSAKMMQAMGAEAIGTSSSAHAFTLGRPDLGYVNRREAIDHAGSLADCLNVPVSGDFENGYGHSADEVAKTIELAIDKGIQGGSIEDIQAPTEEPYSYSDAVERIEAAVAARQNSEGDLVITARADGLMYGKYDLTESIRRIKAFEQAGADVLFVPMPKDIDALSEICSAVDKPVNAICSGRFTEHSISEFARIGVARISLGSSVARLAQRAIYDSMQSIFETGTFGSLANGISGQTVDQLIFKQKDS